MAEIEPLQRRLKSLEEFETPEFVGRMDRVEKRRRFLWYTTVAMTVCIGAVIGLVLF